MEKCIFCSLIKGEIPSAKIYEDEKCLAFLDINPVSPGHALVIPKEHYHMMPDVPEELLAHCFVIAQKLMIRIKEKLGADFVSLSVVGLDVPHFHIHLIPRYYDDGLVGWQTKKYGEGEMQATQKKLTE